MRRNLRAAVISTCVGALLLGCPKRVGSQSDLTPDSREKVEEARRQAEGGRPDEAMRLLREVPEQDNEAVAEVLFTAAEKHFYNRAYAPARDGYRELLARFPLFSRADAAKYHLGLAQLELEDYRDALQILAPLYPRLGDADKPHAAASLARAAEGALAWGDAVRWHAERAARATDEKTQQAANAQALDLLERRVAFVDVARLAQELPPESPLWPTVQFKLARIFAHLRDRDRHKEALEELIKRAPNSPFTADARAMLDRANKRATAKPDTVGLVLPMTGKYKTFGETVLSGIKLALADSKVRLVVRDTAGDPAQARKAVAELTQQEQVIAIIGPVLTAESEDAAAESELEETPIITLTFAEKITDIGPYVFRNMLTNSAQAKALADYAMRVRGFKRFAVLYPNITYGTELANQFWDEVDARDGEIRGIESYEADQTTFGPTIKKLVGRQNPENSEEFLARRREILEKVKDPYRQRKLLEEARKKVEPIIDFEALFIPDYFKNVGLVAPALAVEDVITNACDKNDVERIARTTGKSVGKIKTVQLFGGNGWNFNELVERGGKFVQCSIFVDGFFAKSDRKETRAFVEAYRAANNNRDPALLAAAGYDTARIARFIVENRKPATRAAFREELLRLKDFPGATGPTSFNPKGEVEKPLFFLTIDRDGIRELDSEIKS